MFHSVASSSSAVVHVLLTLSSFTVLSHAFVPAIPTNITDGLASQQQGTLNVFWYPQGTFIDRTRRVAAVSKSDPGIALGALVHFSDPVAAGATTATKTPWVALVACDANSTAPLQDDIFARAKSLGAVAGLLYSLYSQTCVINPGYNASAPPLDVHVLTSATSSKLVESLFNNVNTTRYGSFDAPTLDSEFTNVTTYQQSKVAPDTGYLMVDMAANTPVFSSVYSTLPSGTSSTSVSATANTTSSSSITSTSTSTIASQNGSTARQTKRLLVKLAAMATVLSFVVI
ncbi:hypothetical protein V8D89_011419 [Ganoderma adspersum]